MIGWGDGRNHPNPVVLAVALCHDLRLAVVLLGLGAACVILAEFSGVTWFEFCFDTWIL